MKTVDISAYAAAKNRTLAYAEFRSRVALLIMIGSTFGGVYGVVSLYELFSDAGGVEAFFVNTANEDVYALGSYARAVIMVFIAFSLLLLSESYKSVIRGAMKAPHYLSAFIPLPSLLTGLLLGLLVSDLLQLMLPPIAPLLSAVAIKMGLWDRGMIIDLFGDNSFLFIAPILSSLAIPTTIIAVIYFTVRTILINFKNLSAERSFLKGHDARNRRIDKRYRVISFASFIRAAFLFVVFTGLGGALFYGSAAAGEWIAPRIEAQFWPESSQNRQSELDDLIRLHHGGPPNFQAAARASLLNAPFLAPVLILLTLLLASVPVLERLWSAAALWTRRGAMRDVDSLLMADRRAPVLFLRSFASEDTSLNIERERKSRRGFLSLLISSRAVRLEEEIARAAGYVGPLIGFADPHSKKTKFGAARMSADMDSWQAQIAELMENAGLIVLVYSNSSGVRWELQEIKARGLVDKTVLLFPPHPDDYLGDADNRDLVEDLFGADAGPLTAAAESVSLDALTGAARSVIATDRSLAAYRAAMMIAVGQAGAA